MNINNIDSKEERTLQAGTGSNRIATLASKISHTVSEFFRNATLFFAERVASLLYRVSKSDSQRAHTELMDPQTMSIKDQFLIIKALGKVPADKTEAFTTQLHTLITSLTTATSRSLAIQSVANVPSDKREAFTTQLHTLITTADKSCHNQLIQAVASIPDKERASLLEQASRLYPSQDMGFYRNQILTIIKELPPTQRESFADQMASLITPNITGYDRIEIFESVKKIPADKREAFVMQMFSLFTPDITDATRVTMVLNAASLSEEEIALVVNVLISPDMDEYQRSTILNTLSLIPDPAIRESVIQEALEQFTQTVAMPPMQKIGKISEIACRLIAANHQP